MLKKPNDLDPHSIRYKWRKHRFKIIEGILQKIVSVRGQATVIDVGGTRRYWNLLDPNLASRCTVTLVNEQFWFRPEKTGTCKLPIRFIEHVGDGCNLAEFSSGQFDLAHSNSVIEHVGSLSRMSVFATELRRVGRSYFCQAPYLWFPIEPHHGIPFFHWLPGPTRARLMYSYKVGWRPKMQSYEQALQSADGTQLVDEFLFRELFPDAVIHREKVTILTKSLMAVRDVPPQVSKELKERPYSALVRSRDLTSATEPDQALL